MEFYNFLKQFNKFIPLSKTLIRTEPKWKTLPMFLNLDFISFQQKRKYRFKALVNFPFCADMKQAFIT